MEKGLSLQDRIDSLRDSLTNRLQDLQLKAGVTKIAPRRAYNLVLGAAGGLALGILAALGMAAVSTRIRSSADLREKTGIEPLVEVPSARSIRKRRLREDRIRTLGNIVSSQDSSSSLIVALTDSRGVHGAEAIAEALAKVLAQQEYRTVLVYGDDVSRSAEDASSNGGLDDASLVHQMLEAGEVQSLKILSWPKVFANRYSRMTRERIEAILDELRADADVIVVAAPSVADSTDAQLLSAAADSTVLVVDTGSSRAGDVTSAIEILGRARAVVLGVVLIDGVDARSAWPTTSTWRHSLRASERSSQESQYPDIPTPVRSREQ
jgi:Mrp family chromosome partitioning ATPase